MHLFTDTACGPSCAAVRMAYAQSCDEIEEYQRGTSMNGRWHQLMYVRGAA